MQDLTELLDFCSAIVGFLSALVLASSTIGGETLQEFLYIGKLANRDAAKPDSRTGIPTVVMLSGFVFLFAVVAIAIVSPSKRQLLLSRDGITILFLFLAFGSWIASFFFLGVFHALLRFFESLHWLDVKKYAGWIGFFLLTLSFLLQIASTAIRVFDIELTDQIKVLP